MITAFIQRKLRAFLGIDGEAVRTEARLDAVEETVATNYDHLVVTMQYASKIDESKDKAQEAIASVALATAKLEIEVNALKEELSGLALETVKGEVPQ